MMKPLHGAIALTICGIAIWAVGMLTEPQVRVASEHATEVMTGQVAVLASFHQDDQTDIKLNELKTFRGASADGLLRTDLQGNLIIDMALKRWIDFYLSARGELPLDDIIAAMHSEISQLIQPGQQQAMTLLDNYLGYLAALGEYDEQTGQRLAGADFDAMAARLQWQQRLRREWLQPDVVEAFFAEDEAIDSYTLERIRVARAGGDPAGVSDDVLPQNIRDMRERSRSVISMRSSEADMRAAGAGDDEIHSWRVATFGEEVAQLGLHDLPVVVDPSHAAGAWRFVAPLAKAAIACGADGLMIEVHPDPSQAMSDGAQSLKPEMFKQLMSDLEVFADAVQREF